MHLLCWDIFLKHEIAPEDLPRRKKKTPAFIRDGSLRATSFTFGRDKDSCQATKIQLPWHENVSI